MYRNKATTISRDSLLECFKYVVEELHNLLARGCIEKEDANPKFCYNDRPSKVNISYCSTCSDDSCNSLSKMTFTFISIVFPLAFALYLAE